MNTGCKQQEKKELNLTKIDIVSGIEDEGTKMLLSEIAKDITFIPLETTAECLIGSIGGLRFSDDYIVVIDTNPNQILLFDNTGKFIRKIGSKGQGPGEYLYPSMAVLA